MTALPLTDKLAQSSKRTRANRILSSQFGQGYAQVFRDGPNSQYDKWSFVWENLTASEKTTLNSFYETVGADQFWTYTAPGESTAKKFRIDKESYSDNNISGDLWNVTFTAQQYFDAG